MKSPKSEILSAQGWCSSVELMSQSLILSLQQEPPAPCMRVPQMTRQRWCEKKSVKEKQQIKLSPAGGRRVSWH